MFDSLQLFFYSILAILCCVGLAVTLGILVDSVRPLLKAKP
jgi:ABC-type polysaccharide/polyol phosphate export permease